MMAHPMGESKPGPLRVDFDRRLTLEFHGSEISSDGGLLPYRELDEMLGLSTLAGDALSEVRRGKNTRHLPTGPLRHSVQGRLAGYENVNDAERLASDPVMRAIVDMDRKAMGEACLDDRENAHQHWQIVRGVRVGEKWSALPTGIGSRIAVEAPNSYSDGRDRRLSGECPLTSLLSNL